MPIHEYQCKKCNNVYDVFYTSQAAVSQEEKTEKCPKCGSKRKQKTVSKGTSHVLKGKGWYSDGYS